MDEQIKENPDRQPRERAIGAGSRAGGFGGDVGGGHPALHGGAEERFAATFEQAGIGLAHVSPDGRWLRVNQKLCAIVGYERDELLGRKFQEITHPDDLRGDLEHVQRMLAGEIETYSMEKRYVRKDGSLVWVNLTVSLVRDATGGPAYFVSVIEDVDARKRSEMAQARLAAIVESSDDAIISKSLDGTILTWNNAAQRLFGYAAEEAVGRSIRLIVPPERADEEEQIIVRVSRGERVPRFDTVRLTKDGRVVDVAVTVSPVRDAGGAVVGASKIARDVTERRKAQRAMREAKEALEVASRAKDRFLAMLSHELRTPLAPVLATATYLEAQPDVPERLRSQLSVIRRNVEIEARLIDDLLDVTKIGQGKVELHQEVVDLETAAEQAVETVRPVAEAKGLRLVMEQCPRRHHVWADPARLQQVLWNLLSNAVKFTPAGGEVAVSLAEDADGHVRVEVRDTGIGIDADVLPKVFDPFEQGERSVTRQFGGLGLGLTISKGLAELLGGTLSAASPGKGLGATFTLRLNTMSDHPGATDAIGPSRPAAGSAGPLRILLVEDHEETLQALTRLLCGAGYHVVAVATVRAAVESAMGDRFDVLVCDMGLPDGSGVDVIEAIRTRHLPVRGIALTGYGTDEDVRQTREAGFDTHLTKPVDFQTLIRAISGVSA